MAISGGGSREELIPLKLDDETYGTHRGPAAGLNVSNLRPNLHVYWEAADESKIRWRMNEGWHVIPPDAPERSGLEQDPNFGHALDTVQRRQDVVLMGIPLDKYRERKKEQAAQRQANKDGVAEAWLSKGEPLSQRYGSGAPVYYKAGQHRIVKE